MAQKVSVTLVDDLDGGVATETVGFALDGTAYEIDLSAENAQSLRDAMAQYIGAGRKVSGRAGGSRGGAPRQRRAATAAPETGAPNSSAGRTAEIRDWARENGYTVSERGRISASVLEAYDRAH